MEASRGDEARPRVHVVDSGDTSTAADEIIRGLDGLGIDASVPLPSRPGDVRAVVVLLSAAALRDPVWRARVEALRSGRLVPVRVGDLVDGEVPDFLRVLNWVFYRPHDASFLAQLFTGINTDVGRFRDDRDTRALAERWESESRNPDFLLDRSSEIKRRIRSAAANASNDDPTIPKEQMVQLAGSFTDRYRFLLEATSDAVGLSVLARSIAFGLAAFQGRLDRMFVAEATTPVAFLAASRLQARRRARGRARRTVFRSAVAAVTVIAVVLAVAVVQQAIKKTDNAVAFSVGDIAEGTRPDMAAIKAAASLVDSGTYAGDDGRFRVAVDALSQHWPTGYVNMNEASAQGAVFLSDGSVEADDYSGALWRWNRGMTSRSVDATGSAGRAAFDADSRGDLAAIAHADSVTLIRGGHTAARITGVNGIHDIKLAPADDRILMATDTALWSATGLADASPRPVRVGTWGAPLALVQTTDGHAVALAEHGKDLYLVRDDGTQTDVGPAPGAISDAALAPDGRSFALNIAGTIWTSTGGALTSSGIPIPGVVLAMDMTSDGLVLVSDRTRGSWVADPRTGLDLGLICNGFPSTLAFVVDERSDRLACISSDILFDSLDDIRPTQVNAAPPSPRLRVTTSGQLKSLSIVDGFLRLDRAGGQRFVFDTAGLAMRAHFVKPSSIANADFFATGASIGADGRPTTVAVSPDGHTFAVGFDDGHFIEVDIDKAGHLAPVGSWQLPDHSPVESVGWKLGSHEITASTAAGSTWARRSCAGCWADHTLISTIAARAWLCYEAGDIDSLGDTARTSLHLRSCSARWGRS